MISKLSNSSLLSKTYYKSMLAGNQAYDPNGFQLLETALVSSGVASVTFDVSQYASMGYKHLQIRSVSRMAYSDAERSLNIRFNSDSTSSYYNHGLYGSGSSVASYGFSQTEGFIGSFAAANATSGSYGSGVTDILDAFSSTKYKVIKSLAGSTTTPQVSIRSVLWSKTSPITSITLLDTTSNIVAGSRFSIYGIKG